MPNTAPHASAGGPYYVQVGNALVLSAAASFDADGDPLYYRWDLDGDGQFDDVVGVGPTIPWAMLGDFGLNGEGAYTIALQVGDDPSFALASTATSTVTVYTNDPPAFSGGDTVSVTMNENNTNPMGFYGVSDPQLAFQGLSLSISGGADAALFYVLGNYGLYFHSAPNFEAPIDANGDNIYEVTARLTDSDGAYDEQTVYVTIVNRNEAPTAVAAADASHAAPGQSILFDASGSTDPDAGGTHQYRWTFGDGSPSEWGVGQEGILSHAFTLFGTYTVVLEAFDQGGLSSTTQLTIVIDQGNVAPVADLGGPYEVVLGGAVALDGVNSYDPNTSAGDRIVQWEWDVNGDGDYEITGVSSVDLSSAAIIVMGEGQHDIALRLTDTFGAVTVASTTLMITNSPPAITSGSGDTAFYALSENHSIVAQIEVSDPQQAFQTLTLSIVGGSDAALFGISGSGDLYFANEPDFDAPADLGGDNTYDVTIRVTDSLGAYFDQTVSVGVTDTADAVYGTEVDDAIVANAAGGSYFGLGGNDAITGSAGADLIDGGAGADRAIYGVASTVADWFRNPDGTWTVSVGAADTIASVERLDFTDRDVFLDRAAQTFTGDGTSDLLLRHTNGTLSLWFVEGAAIAGVGFGSISADWTPQSGDFNGDGRDDILWRNTSSGAMSMWFMDGAAVTGVSFGSVATNWVIEGLGDFNGDTRDDILWRNTTSGDMSLWFLNGTAVSGGAFGNVGSGWVVETLGDFNGDGRDDILWRESSSGAMSMWFINGQAVTGGAFGTVGSNLVVEGAGDFNGDGRDDIFWRNSATGDVSLWFMNGQAVTGYAGFGINNDWDIAALGDYNGDGRDDIIWRHDDASMVAWFINGASVTGQSLGSLSTDWIINPGG